MKRRGIFPDDSPHVRAVYSRAACIYRKVPAGVFFPEHEDDLGEILDHASGTGTPLTPRGGGSGLAGQTVGEGFIVDHSRHLTSVAFPREDEAVVSMGVVLSSLNRALADRGMVFPPDPSSQDFCTIGGMIANNSKGARSVKYGGTSSWLNWVEVLLHDGELVRVENRHIAPGGYCHHGLRRVAAAISDNREAIVSAWPLCRANTSGYNLRDCVGPGGTVNLLPLFAGSEGTLGIFTRASLRLMRNPEARALAIAEFASVKEAAEATLQIVKHGPSACELLDGSFVDMVRRGEGEFPVEVSGACSSLLIIETDGGSVDEAEEAMASVVRSVTGGGRFTRARGPLEKQRIWAFRKAASPLLNRGRGRLKSVRFIEDGSVPAENIPAYVRGVTEILGEEGIDVVIFGHSGDGNFHVNPFMDLTSREHFEAMPRIAEKTARLIASLRGSLAGEHGDGRLRTPYLRVVYGNLVDLFLGIKKILDPRGLFNPGMIAAEDPDPMWKDTRFSPGYARTLMAGELSQEKWLVEAERCHGCGTCRDFCPTAKALRFDPASSRGRAHLLQEVLCGGQGAGMLSSRGALEVFDSCLGCSECLKNCPTGVDIAPLAALVLKNHATPSLKARNAFFTGLSSLPYKAPRVFGALAPRLRESGILRKAGEKLAGLRPGIRYPAPGRGFAFDPSKLYIFEGSGRGAVILFYGCYGNIYNKEGETMVALDILDRLGVRVIVPPQACCGVGRISKGLMDLAAEDVVFNQKNFLRYLDEGAKIVYTATSCGMAIKREHPMFFPSAASEKMAGETLYLSEYLLSLFGKEPPGLERVEGDFCYQVPCHARLTGADEADMRLLEMVPGLVFRGRTATCCGMSGTFGLQGRNEVIAGALGDALKAELDAMRSRYIATPCGSCRTQVQGLTDREVLHPLALFARALGINRP